VERLGGMEREDKGMWKRERVGNRGGCEGWEECRQKGKGVVDGMGKESWGEKGTCGGRGGQGTDGYQGKCARQTAKTKATSYGGSEFLKRHQKGR